MTRCSRMVPLLMLTINLVFWMNQAQAREIVGRLGVGVTNQLVTDMPAISFKILNSKSFGVGGLFGLSTEANGGGYGAGLKIYRVIFEEPQLNFYASVLGALVKQKSSVAANDTSGFQADFTLGSEFAFQGLDSLGFSFEFGVSLNKLNDFVVETVGHNFITAAVHFYL